MKRLLGIIVAAVILYAIYHDISYGTLPAVTSVKTTVHKTAPETEVVSKPTLPYFEKKVMSGDTVLSILEEKLEQSIPVPISNVVSDFEKLNNGISPQDIQPGKTYKFPTYQISNNKNKKGNSNSQE